MIGVGGVCNVGGLHVIHNHSVGWRQVPYGVIFFFFFSCLHSLFGSKVVVCLINHQFEGKDDSNSKREGYSETQIVVNPIGNINPNARIAVELFNGNNYKEWS